MLRVPRIARSSWQGVEERKRGGWRGGGTEGREGEREGWNGTEMEGGEWKREGWKGRGGRGRGGRGREVKKRTMVNSRVQKN